MNTSDRIQTYLRDQVHLPDSEAATRANDLLALFGTDEARPLLGWMPEHWWLFLLRGLLAIGFGILTIWQPLAALMAVVIVFGAWAFVDGISALVLGFSGRRSWELILIGFLGIAVGVITFFRPGATALGLYTLVAAWSIAHGVIEIALAIKLRREIRGEFWLILAGLASIAFGALLIALPVTGVIALVWLISLYALSFGVLMVGFAFRLRGRREERGREIPIRTPTPQYT